MFDTTQIPHLLEDRHVAPRNHRLALAQDYLAEHADGLIETARWLGGPKAGQATLALVAEIAEAECWQRRFTDRLERLHRLLSLAFADNPAHPSWDAVAADDPDGPEVEAACRHAEGIGAVLDV